MNIFGAWWFYVILYLMFALIFNQCYKVATRKAKRDGALTVLLQLIGGISILALCPLFDFKFPSDIKIYLLLLAACIFYAISDRMNTTVRKGIEASTFAMINQLSTVFLIIGGFLFFKEEVIITKIIGAALIIISNIIIFYKKGELKTNKYILLAILANVTIAIAISLDVSISENFNLPMYVSITLVLPAIFIFITERIKIKDIKNEIIGGNKGAIFATGVSWGLLIVSTLKAYQLGEVTRVAPLCALTVILNVIAAYIFLKERDSVLKKVIAAVLIAISIILIKIG